MPRVTFQQTNFTAGELSPRLLGRVDIARYQNGAKRIENGLPLVYGGVLRRYGSRYVAATKTAAKKTRLIPFVFSRTQAYILEFGDLYMRVYANGAQVLSGMSPYEIATPYTEAMLFELEYAQSADTMFIAHKDVPVQRLRRQGNADWSLSAAPFIVTPFSEIGTRPAATLTLSAATVGTGRTFTASAAVFLASDVGRDITSGYGLATITGFTSTTVVTCEIKVAFSSTSIASGAWVLEGSPQTTCTASAKDPVGASITLTLGAAGWRTEDVGKFVQLNDGLVQITGFTSDTIVNATIKRVLTSVVAVPAAAWSLESTVWTAANGYPRAVTLFEQRLVTGGSTAYPNFVWGSRIDEYLDFTQGTADDDGFAFALAADMTNPVVHLAASRQLTALTYGGEFTMTGGVEKPLTPTNVQVKNQSIYGSTDAKPVKVGNELLFVQRAGRKLRAMSYKYDSDSFASPDLSVLAEHVTQPTLVDMAYQGERESILWAVRADGVMATLTLDRDQDVVGWARQITDGQYESVATIPAADGDEVWSVVKRTINGSTVRYVERFVPDAHTDAHIVGTHPTGAATWTGLTHLEGKTVDIVADGVVMPSAVVSGGQITLSRNAKAVEIGLHYDTTIETLTPEIQTGTGSAQGNSMRTAEVTMRFLDTIGASVNGQTIAFRRFGPAVLDQPVPPFTGLHRVETLGWERGNDSLVIQQTQPLPFHLLAVIQKLTVND